METPVQVVCRDTEVSDDICDHAKVIVIIFRSCQKGQVFTISATPFGNKFHPTDSFEPGFELCLNTDLCPFVKSLNNFC